MMVIVKSLKNKSKGKKICHNIADLPSDYARYVKFKSFGIEYEK